MISGMRKGASMVIAGSALAAGALVPYLTGSVAEHPLGTAMAAQVALSAAFLVAVGRSRRRLDIFNPLVLTALAFPLMYTWPAALTASGRDRFSQELAPWLHVLPGLQAKAALIATVGLAAIGVGYLSECTVSRRRLRTPITRLHRFGTPAVRRRAFVLALVGLALFGVYTLIVGGPRALLLSLSSRVVSSAGRNYLASGPLFAAAAGAALLVREDRWPPSRLCVVLISAGLGLAVLTGSKANIGVVILLLICVVHWKYRWFAVTVVIPLVALGALGLVSYDLYFRDALPRGVSFTQVVRDRGGILAAAEHDFVQGNFFGHQALAIAIEKFPAAHPYTGATSLVALATAPVPRGIYSGKPEAPSALFTNTFAPEFRRAGSSIPPTAIGEAYMSFGPGGVVAVCWALGYVFSRTYRRRFDGPRQMYTAALCAALVIHALRGESYGVVVLFLLLWLPALLLLPSRPLTARANAENSGLRPSRGAVNPALRLALIRSM